MHTDKDLLVKGLRQIGYTVVLMFTAPIVLSQAIKNEEHAWFLPIVIIGFILAIAAIVSGFYSIKIIMEALFAKKKE